MSYISSDVIEKNLYTSGMEPRESKSDFIISEYSSAKNTIESYSEETEHGVYEFISRDEGDLMNIKNDLSQNENMHNVESKVSEISKNIDIHNDDRNDFDTFVVNQCCVTMNEEQKNITKPLDAEIKRTTDPYNSEKDNFSLRKSDFIILDYFTVGLLRNENVHSVEPNAGSESKNLDMHNNESADSVGNHSYVCSDEKEKNIVKEIKQSTGSFCNSENNSFNPHKSDFVISDDVAEENKIVFGYEKTKPGIFELKENDDLLCNIFDLSLNEDRVGSNSEPEPENVDMHNDDSIDFDISEVNHSSVCSDKKEENFIEPLDAEIKQSTYSCCSSDGDRFNPRKSGFKISDDLAGKNKIVFGYEKTKHSIFELKESDLLCNKFDFSPNNDSVESNSEPEPENVDMYNDDSIGFDISEVNHSSVCLDKKEKNFIEPLDAEIKQSTYSCCSSDEDRFNPHKSDFKISDDFSKKNKIVFGYEKTKPDIIELKENNELLCNKFGLLLSKDSPESNSEPDPENVDMHNDDSIDFDISEINHSSVCSDKKEKNFIDPLDAEIKQSTYSCCSSDEDSFNLHKGDFKVSDDFAVKNKIVFGYEKAKPDMIELKENDDLLCNKFDFSPNEDSVESISEPEPENVDMHNDDNIELDISDLNHSSVSTHEKENKIIETLDAEIKQNTGSYSSSDGDSFNSHKSDIIILDDLTSKRISVSEYENIRSIIDELKEDNDLLSDKYDLSQNEDNFESNSEAEPENLGMHNDDSTHFGIFDVNHSSVRSDQKNPIEPLDAETKQTIDFYNSKIDNDSTHFDISDVNHSSVSSYKKNPIEPDAETKQTIDSYNSKINSFSSRRNDFITSNNVESISVLDCAKTKPGIYELKEDNNLLRNQNNLSQNENIDSVESEVYQNIDMHKDNSNEVAISSGENQSAVRSKEGQKNCIEAQDTEASILRKQTIDECYSSEKDRYNLIIPDGNSEENTSIHDLVTRDKCPEYRKCNIQEQDIKGSDCSESDYVNYAKKDFCEDETRPPLDTVFENISVTVRESELINDDFAANNEEKSGEVFQTLSMLCCSLEKVQMKRREREITMLKSKIKTIPDDSSVIVISDDEEENCRELTDGFNVEKETKDNANVQSREQFCEEIDNELEILKAQYFDVQRKLVNGSENFEIDDVVSKIKEVLTGFLKSLEEVRTRCRNKLLKDKSKIKNEHIKPFRSYDKHSEKTVETPLDEYRFRSGDFIRVKEKTHRLYEKIVSHHSYEHDSQVSPIIIRYLPHSSNKSIDKYPPKPKCFSSFEKETCEILHRKKRNSSPYERNFQKTPVKKFRTCSTKCCLSEYGKETTDSPSEEETDFRGYNSELNYFPKMGGISKSYMTHKKIAFSRSSPKNYPDHISYSKQTSNSREKFKNILTRTCSRKEVSENRYERKYSRKHRFENYFSSDSNDSVQISSVSDSDVPIYLGSKTRNGRTKYLKSEIVAASGYDEDTSRRKRFRRRTKDNQYEKDVSPIYSSDSDFYNFVQEKHDKYKDSKKKTDKKKAHTLVDRQMNLINKHHLVKPVQVSPIASNIHEKNMRKNDSSKRKFSDEINTLEDMTSMHENQKKRKNKVPHQYTPCKMSKIRNDTNVYDNLKNKYSTQSCKAKLESIVSSPPRDIPISPVEKKGRKIEKETDGFSTQTLRDKMKKQNVTEHCNFDSRYSDKTCASFLKKNRGEYTDDEKEIGDFSTQSLRDKMKKQNVTEHCNFDSRNPDKTCVSFLKEKQGKYTNDEKKIDDFSTQTLKDKMKKQNETEHRNFDSRYSNKTCTDVVQEGGNVQDEDWSQKDLNTVKDMESYVSFLKKKRGKYTNAELLFEKPEKSISQKILSVNSDQEAKYRASNIDRLQAEYVLDKRIQGHTKKDLVLSQNVSDKVKAKTRILQTASKKDKQSETGKTATKMSIEGKKEFVSNKSRLDSFKKLNLEIGKMKSSKRRF